MPRRCRTGALHSELRMWSRQARTNTDGHGRDTDGEGIRVILDVGFWILDVEWTDTDGHNAGETPAIHLAPLHGLKNVELGTYPMRYIIRFG